MYSPLVKGLNNALDKLSGIKVSGLPDYKEEHQIVFVRTNARCIANDSDLQGQFKPDIVLLRWDTFKEMKGGPSPLFSDTYTSDLCCKSGANQPKPRWKKLLSTVEVKRLPVGKAGAARRFSDKLYCSRFRDLGAESKADGRPKYKLSRGRGERFTRSRMSIFPSTLPVPSPTSVPPPVPEGNKEPASPMPGWETTEQKCRLSFESEGLPRKRLKTVGDAPLEPVGDTPLEPVSEIPSGRVKRAPEVQSAIYATRIISSSFNMTHTINILLKGTWIRFEANVHTPKLPDRHLR